MLSDRDRQSLTEIRDNILFAKQLVANLDLNGFRNSQVIFYAVTRAIEIISEASRRSRGGRWPE